MSCEARSRLSERSSFRDNCDLSFAWILIWSTILRISGQTSATPASRRVRQTEESRYSRIPSWCNLLTSAHTYVSHQHAYNIRVINVWLPACRSNGRACFLPPPSLPSLVPLLPIARHPFVSVEPPWLSLHRRLASLSSLVTPVASLITAPTVVWKFSRACHSYAYRARSRINRSANNVVGRIVAAAECESRLCWIPSGAHRIRALEKG